MSTETGEARLVADVVADAKRMLEEERVQTEQLDMLDPVTPEDMLEARMELGPGAGNMAVVRHARAKRRGRPAGSRNKRTDDFARYLLQFGQHPAITMMQIQATPAEVLMEQSRRLKARRRTKSGIEVDVTATMTYEAAQSLRIRCAEGLMPYLESKKPVAVDMTFTGVADLVIEGVTHSREEIGELIEGEYLPIDDDDSVEGGE